MTAASVVYKSEFARTGEEHHLGWMVDNLDRVMAQLRERGVTFEDYDQADLKTEGGVASDPAMGKCARHTGPTSTSRATRASIPLWTSMNLGMRETPS